MTTMHSVGEMRDRVRALATPLFAQGVDKIYVVVCCKRLLVSSVRPIRCRTCTTKPKFKLLYSLKDVESLQIEEK